MPLILLSIFPSLLLLPFAYTSTKSAVFEWTLAAVMECVRNADGMVSENIYEDCGWTDSLDTDLTYAESNVVGDKMLFRKPFDSDVFVALGRILIVFKPYVEAFMILFLLSNFRAALFSWLRQLVGLKAAKQETTAKRLTIISVAPAAAPH